MIRLAVFVAIEVLVAAVLHLAAGTDLAHTVMALVAAVAVTVMVVGQQDPRSPRWPRAESEAKDGARDDISALSWSFLSRDDAVTQRAVRAVRAATLTRLGLHGIDLDDPEQAAAARTFLGDEAYNFVESRLAHPTLAELGRTVDRLTALDPADPPTRPAPQAQSPTPPTRSAA